MGMSPNPKALLWAIERCGESVDSLKKRWPKIEQWIDRSHEPTLRQLEDFARLTHVALDLLFGDDVPRLDLQIADFRTLEGLGGEPSPELYDTVTQMQYRQDWLREYYVELGCDEIPFVGLLDARDMEDAGSSAAAIRDYLGLGETWAFAERGVSGALRALRDKIEAQRISVIINGIVGDNTRRPLNVAEFRGFVLADNMAPFVFVNGRDAKSAQIFTLAHELAHLAFSRTGVVQPCEDISRGTKTERLCDAIAAEMLVPRNAFFRVWDDSTGAYQMLDKLRRSFKVSFIVCARRALDLGLVSEAEFASSVAKHRDEVEKAVPESGSGGGNYYLTKAYRVGHVFGEAVFAATQTRRITYREAFRLTGLNAKTFDEYFRGYAA